MKLVIVDDDENAAKAICFTIEDAGYTPWIFQERGLTLCEIVQRILENAVAAVCDHRLRPLGFASFDGAELAAELMKHKFPVVLISQFVSQDYDVSIRQWRAALPSVLTRDQFRAETLNEALDKCRKEINGEINLDRRAHRALIRVADIQTEGNKRVIDAIVPSWNRSKALRFPCDLMPIELQEGVKQGDYLIAKMNLGSPLAEDIFFSDFEKAPTPRDEIFT